MSVTTTVTVFVPTANVLPEAGVATCPATLQLPVCAGNVPITRSHFDQTSFLRKLLAYETTWTQNLHRTRFHWQRFRVLTVTTTRERVQGMIEACRSLKHGYGLFLFLDAKTLMEQADFFALRWRTAREGDASELLDSTIELRPIANFQGKKAQILRQRQKRQPAPAPMMANDDKAKARWSKPDF